jgi:phytoene dehydrogenase-like protein
MAKATEPVIIVGAGIAGLTCARYLSGAGVPVRVFEQSDAVGGRVRTDQAEGFRLDRGFQVLQTAYPEARALLDYEALELQRFDSGALIHSHGRWLAMLDPWRHPVRGLRALTNGIGTPRDRWRLARLRGRLLRTADETLLSGPDESTEQFLLGTMGFSRDMVDRFFRPWFAGIFLERGLESSSRLFCFVFKMLAAGPAAVPREGMHTIPEQLAAMLPSGTVSLNSPVASIAEDHVRLTSGDSVPAAATVIATTASTRDRLLGRGEQPVAMRATRTLYFAAPQSPLGRPLLVLSADRTSPVNHLAVMSDVAPSYSASDQALISASIVEPEAQADKTFADAARQQMRTWFGESVDAWRLIREQRISDALPVQHPGDDAPMRRSARLGAGLYACGDGCDTGSLNGAMASGRRAAEAILADHGVAGSRPRLGTPHRD